MLHLLRSVFFQFVSPSPIFFFFFFNDTATTEIYTLSLHDALPICRPCADGRGCPGLSWRCRLRPWSPASRYRGSHGGRRPAPVRWPGLGAWRRTWWQRSRTGWVLCEKTVKSRENGKRPSRARGGAGLACRNRRLALLCRSEEHTSELQSP